MITTVLFDMDGLLLDTEPLWGESMLRVAQKHGIPVTYERFKETTGLRIHEVTDYWSVRYAWQGSTAHVVAEEILDDIISSAIQYGRIMPGIPEALALLRAQGYKTGLASSSPMRMIAALLDHFGLYDFFDEVTSADAVALGKPHPAVFLHCAAALGVTPLQCVVLEDSLNGIIAGKAARMKVIAVPDGHHIHNPKFAVADAIIPSMKQFDLALLQRL